MRNSINDIKALSLAVALLLPVGAMAQGDSEVPASVWKQNFFSPAPQRNVVFDMTSEGKSLPILWGFDTAWNDYGNMLRGIRYAGKESIGVARVSFQPWAVITEKGVLPEMLKRNLEARLKNVALVGKKVDIALNLDAGEPTVKEVYGYIDADNSYVGDPEKVADAYALLIDATAAAVEEKGYNVVSAAPFNEPDFYWNGTPINVFHEIDKRLKNFDEFPRFRNIRISGGNTLNCDCALPWYSELKEFLDEGNTHQLAGDFNHYAEFFQTVRNDGKYATADELHNVMEAMVGVEYGMQTGIWWGTAEQARGEFCKASFGKRLGYAENRDAWSAASVYRAPSGKVQGFLGCSERQAKPSSYNFVSLSGPVYVDGYGPTIEYMVNLPGDPEGAYQTELQRNAETMVNITRGEDIQPAINGSYYICDASGRSIKGKFLASGGSDITLTAEPLNPSESMMWNVVPVPENQGGDFSYYFIRTPDGTKGLDDMNWNLDDGATVITYASSGNSVQQWALEYDGGGYFYIRNKHSGLYLFYADNESGVTLKQTDRDKAEKWRLLPSGITMETTAPTAPSALVLKNNSASIELSWSPSADANSVTYNVLRSDEGSTDFNTIGRVTDLTSFIDNSIVKGRTYTYKIKVIDALWNSPSYSEAVSTRIEGGGQTAHFPLKESLECEGENDFSLKALITPTYYPGPSDNLGAVYFRNQQYLQLPYSLLEPEEFTVMFRAYRQSSTDGLVLFTTGVSEEESLSLLPLSGDGMKLVSRHEGEVRELTLNELARNEWVHLALSFNGADLTFFVNGKEEGKIKDCADAMPEHRLLTYIGRAQNPDTRYFMGRVSDIRTFDYALTPDEVKNVMEYGSVSGVETITSQSVMVYGEEYYSLTGVRLDSPADKGVTIVVRRYSDGSVKTDKILK